MSTDPRADTVSSQYERWVYPEPIVDLPAWVETLWQWPDPSHSHRLFWPSRETADDLDILVAGCGTNQAAILAYTNPTSRITAIDVSQPSLDHHRFLKDKYALDNLELHLLPIEEVGSLERDFDLIVSTGVLHHMADPAEGMAALAACLRPDGVVTLMLYARYGRIGVEMLQGVFRELGLAQDQVSVQIVKEALAVLPAEHPLQDYISIAPDLQFDAGLVDTFLHGRDRSFTTGDCIELVTSAGLVFDEWLLKSPYAIPAGTDNAFYAALAKQPREAQWSVMERINARNGCHFFSACRPERPVETYRIDFASERFLDYVPSLRYRCALGDAEISRSDWTVPLNESQLALLRPMDGTRSIRELVAEASNAPTFATVDPERREQYARELFESLWHLDVLAMGITAD
jgi:SAM-dependent methyltransferase